ncbi:hypothetical protein VP01_845g1 [Puccinia sorghi]|uniref:Uncharacterized protein n=1 Tax=Puccinia sorghi TaxID=27349 RepID=A0A0L6U987_9BASI|nr:hypothetical protein VP01_845g1 [Puccinia sorghi]
MGQSTVFQADYLPAGFGEGDAEAILTIIAFLGTMVKHKRTLVCKLNAPHLALILTSVLEPGRAHPTSIAGISVGLAGYLLDVTLGDQCQVASCCTANTPNTVHLMPPHSTRQASSTSSTLEVKTITPETDSNATRTHSQDSKKSWAKGRMKQVFVGGGDDARVGSKRVGFGALSRHWRRIGQTRVVPECAAGAKERQGVRRLCGGGPEERGRRRGGAGTQCKRERGGGAELWVGSCGSFCRDQYILFYYLARQKSGGKIGSQASESPKARTFTVSFQVAVCKEQEVGLNTHWRRTLSYLLRQFFFPHRVPGGSVPCLKQLAVEKKGSTKSMSNHLTSCHGLSNNERSSEVGSIQAFIKTGNLPKKLTQV